MLLEKLEDRRVLATWSTDITTDTTWTNDEVQHVVADIAVLPGVTLTIEPGTMVQFSGLGLTVQGTLNAAGTDAEPILITSDRDDTGFDGVLGTADDVDTTGNGPEEPFAGAWRNIRFTDTSIGNVMDHVEMRAGGSDFVGQLVVNGSDLTLSNSRLRIGVAGMRITDSQPEISSTSFENHGFHAISMNLTSQPVLSDLEFSNNGTNALLVDAGELPGDTSWSNPGTEYVTAGEISVPAGVTLTIAPGQMVKSPGPGFIVHGTLHAVGTAGAPILFTSVRDDSGFDGVLGTADDFNTRGGSFEGPFRGAWENIEFTDTSTGSILDHVEVRAGDSEFKGQLVLSSAELTLANSLIRTGNIGLRINNSNPTVLNTRFEDHGFQAIGMDLASDPEITNFTSNGNGTNGLLLDAGVLPGDSKWDDPDIVYVPSGEITVPVGSTLTIDAGQMVQFIDQGITVEGTLLAKGAAARPILMTSIRDDTGFDGMIGTLDDVNTSNNATEGPFRGAWQNIEFTSTSTGSSFDYVEIRAGDSVFEGQLVVNGGELTLANSWIRTGNQGLRIVNSNPTVTNTRFEDHRFNAIYMDLASNPSISGVTAVGNGVNGLAVDGGTLVGDAIWDDPEIVYVPVGDIVVPLGSTLTIGAGQVVKFLTLGGTLDVSGRLLAQGSFDAPIIFTSSRDDSAGGDTNNNGPTTGFAGDWNTVRFQPTSTASVMDYVETRYGGFGPQRANIDINGGELTLRNSLSRNATNHGIIVRNTGHLEIHNTLSYDTAIGLFAAGGSTVDAWNNNFDANTHGVYVDAATADLTNNQITNNGQTGVFAANAATINAAFNNVFNPGGVNYQGMNDLTGTSGNISADPKYFSQPNRQYQLRGGSPAIDAGTSDGAPATDRVGNPRFDDPNVINRGAGAMPYVDLGAFERQETSTSDVDLAVVSVSGPTSGRQDELVNVAWTGRNEGTAPAPGPWRDAVYLSVDPIWTPDDVFLGEVVQAGTVAAGAEYTLSTNVTLPGVLPGDYFFLVRSNWQQEVFEATALRNNTGVSTDAVQMDVPELILDVAQDASLAVGEAKLFKVVVPSAETLSIDLVGAAGATNELYVSYAAVPTRQVFDARGNRPDSADQAISIANTLAGEYLVMVFGSDVPTPQTITLEASLAGFAIDSISPSEGANVGNVTIAVTGAQFTDDSIVQLVDSSGGTIDAVANYLGDSGLIAATFDLNGAPVGAADIRVINPGNVTTELIDAFNVIQGVPGRLTMDLSAPSRVRAGRSFELVISYSNDGDTDLLAPLFEMVGTGANEISLYSDLSDSFLPGEPLKLLATNSDGPAGILPPGATASITLYVNATAISLNEFQVNFASFPNTPIDWATLGPAIRPPGFDETQWAAIVAQLESDIGNSWGDLQMTLSEAATLLPPNLGLSYSQADVFAIPVARAMAALNTSVTGRLFLNNPTIPFADTGITLRETTTGDVFATTTWNDGTFIIDSIIPGTYEVLLEGFTPQDASPVVVPAGGLDHLQVIAEPAASISGSVIHNSGFPIRDLAVAALADDGTYASAFTDNDGLFRIDSLPANTYDVTAGGLMFTRATVADIELAAGARVGNIVFVLRDGATVSGQVTALDGSPVEGVLVNVDTGDIGGVGAITDANGEYVITGVPGGTFDVSTHTNGVVRSIVPNVVIPTGGTVENVNLQYGPAGSLTGTVTRLDDGSPVDLAVVNVLLDETSILTQTDSDGTFVVEGLAPGNYTLRLESDEFQTVNINAVVNADAATDVPITLSELGTASGTVTALAGDPLANVIVHVISDIGFVDSTVTDAAGNYTLPGLDTGNFEVILGDVGTPGAVSQSVSVTSAATTFDVDFQVDVSGTINGTVFNTDGTTPVDVADVTAFVNGEPLLTVPVDDDGDYSFVLLQAGQYRLEATAADFAFPVITGLNVAGGATIIGQDFVAGSESIVGVVTDFDTGTPLADAIVLIESTDTQFPAGRAIASLMTGPDGSFVFDAAVAGNYSVLVSRDGYAALRQAVVVTGGTAADASAALAVGGRLVGTVRDAQSGDLLTAVTLVLTSRDDPTFDLAAFADDDGQYQFDSLPPGIYFLTVIVDGYESVVTADFNVSEGENLRDVSMLVANASVTGTVLSGTRPLRQVLVSATDSAGNLRGQSFTDNDGTYMIDLPPGSFTVSAAANGALEAAGQLVTVNDSAVTADVDFELNVIAISDPPGEVAEGAVSGLVPDWIKRALNLPGEHENHLRRSDPNVSDLFVGLDPRCQQIGRALLAAISAQDTALKTWKDQASTLGGFGSVGRSLSEMWTLGNEILVHIEWLINFENNKARLKGAAAAALDAVRDAATEVGSRLRDALSKVRAGDISGALDGLKPEIKVNEIPFDLLITAIDAAKAAFVGVRDHALTKQTFETLDALIETVNNFKVPFSNVQTEFLNWQAVLDAGKTYDDAVAKANLRLSQMERCVNHGEIIIIPGFEPGTTAGPSKTVNGVAAIDPNDKIGAAGFATEEFIQAGNIPYLIQFENDPDLGATIPAQEVFITDILESDLDLSTFEFTGFGFNNFEFDIPSGLTNYEKIIDLRPDSIDLLVEVILDIDMASRELSAAFRSLDPLTFLLPDDIDAGFLPVNDKQLHNGEGYVSFNVSPLSALPTGTQITNQASIIFDVNEPILTPTALNTIDAGDPTSSVSDLPAAAVARDFMVDWAGQDDVGGSGVASYDIFVSENGGAFTPWLLGTTETSSLFTGGEIGTTYGFLSVARDNVGHREAMPLLPDTQTIVGPWVNPINVFDVNAVDGPTALDVLLIINELGRNTVSDPDTGMLVELPPQGFAPPFYDVAFDGFITALDALRVINELGRLQGQGEAVGESVDEAMLTLAQQLVPTLSGNRPISAEPAESLSVIETSLMKVFDSGESWSLDDASDAGIEPAPVIHPVGDALESTLRTLAEDVADQWAAV